MSNIKHHKNTISHEEFMLSELAKDKEFADGYIEAVIEDYENGESGIECIVFSFERFIEARGLQELFELLSKLNYMMVFVNNKIVLSHVCQPKS